MNNLKYIQNQDQKKSENQTLKEVLKVFNLENIEYKNPNDFFLKFKELFLNNALDIHQKILDLKTKIEQNNFYEAYLFFIKYYQIEIDGEIIKIFSKELFEKSNNLEDFLDNISIKIHEILYPILETKNNNGLNGLIVSTESISISPSTNKIEGLFGLDIEAGKLLLFNYIKYFVIYRGLNFPKIKEIDNYKGISLSEYDIGDTLDIIFCRKNKKSLENFPNAKEFILSLIRDFSGYDKDKKLRMNEFSIGNMIPLYLGELKDVFSLDDVKDLLVETYKHKDSFFHYLMSTEGDIISEFIQVIKNENIEELSIENINLVYKLYINLNIKKLLSYGYNIFINKKDNSFFIAETKFEANIEKNVNIGTKEKIKIFLGDDESPLIEFKKYHIEAKKEITQLFLEESEKEFIVINDVNSPLVEKFKELIINSNITDFERSDPNILIENTLSYNRIIEDYKTKIERLIKKGGEKYNSLLFGYDKHFMPIGGKVHFKESLSDEKKEKLEKAYSFGSTPFKLQHADDSMLLPPCESPFQLIEILKKLHSLEIVNDGDIELQLSIAGRLPNDLSGILASSMIFLKNYQITYPKEAFYTGDWDQLTKSCIICYDAGVLEKEGFSNIGHHINGRTDILGVRKIEEVLIFSIISNLISQSYFGGVHQELGKEFISEYKKLLKKHNILEILDGKWVHNPDDSDKDSDFDDYSEHYELVKICTDKLNSSIENANSKGDYNSIIFELRKIVHKYIDKGELLSIESKKLLS